MDEYQPRRTARRQQRSVRHRLAHMPKRVWAYLGGLCLMAAVIAVVWASVAPALSVPTLAATILAHTTFDAGGSHNIAIGSDGKLRAWGENTYGGLGDGSTQDRLAPTAIVTVGDWVMVSAGEWHTMAIAADGSLWIWGSNNFGQIGDGTFGVQTMKSQPLSLDPGTTWKAVAAGYGHSLAIRSDGSLWSWGYNYNGQLGIGSIGDRTIPMRVNYDSDWVAIAAGDYHSLALKADGSLWAWGLNDDGEVGDGDIVDRYAPVRIGTENDWVAIAAGEYSSYGIKADGSLWAWGQNKYGQLADGSNTNRLAPEIIGEPFDWAVVAAGGKHALAIKADGTLWSWGENVRGELGDGTTDMRNTMGQVGTKSDWVAISAGRSHSLAMNSTGELWAWGYNYNGQVGDNTNSERHTPVKVLSGVQPPVTTTTTSTSSSTTTTTASTSSTSTTSTTESTTTTTTGSATFTDVPASHPYHDAIVGLTARKIVSGYADGTFHPDEAVTRQQFAKMIVGVMGLKVSEDDWQDAHPPFTDLGKDNPSSLYPHDYIAVAKANGLTEGKTATTFAPLANITRAQMVTMVVRAAQHSGTALDPVGSDYAGTFKKYNDKTHGANVKLAEANGLLEGLQISGSPAAWISGTATRGEVAQILWNLFTYQE